MRITVLYTAVEISRALSTGVYFETQSLLYKVRIEILNPQISDIGP